MKKNYECHCALRTGNIQNESGCPTFWDVRMGCTYRMEVDARVRYGTVPHLRLFSKINILLKYVLKKKATGGFSVPLLCCRLSIFPDISNDFKRAKSISMVKRF